MPGLRDLARTGVTFSGLSSLGLPTISAVHALSSGAPPLQSALNLVGARFAEFDDLPSFMRGEGYRSLFVSTQSPSREAFQHLFYRRPALDEARVRLRCADGYGDLFNDTLQRELGPRPLLRRCDAAQVDELARRFADRDFPLWFDYIASYFPTERQAELLNLSYASLVFHSFYADRIASQQFKAHWRQQRALLNRTGAAAGPVFALAFDIDSHTPYLGYDNDAFYDGMQNKTKEQRFKRVNHYADRYFVRETIDFLRREDPNTIVVVTGDHGTRDVPVRGKETPVTNQTVFSDNCVGKSSSVDSLFVVSAVVSYLGDDPEVKRALGLDTLAGKTFKFGSDHGDLTYTIMEIVSRLNGHSLPPTSRRSRNLVDLSNELLNLSGKRWTENAFAHLDSSGWQSISALSYQIEYRNGSQMLRTHTSDASEAQYYGNVSYPTCLHRFGAPSVGLGGPRVREMTTDAFRFLSHENYLLLANSLYNYRFRNTSCVTEGHCEFPERRRYVLSNTFFIVLVLMFPLGGMLLGSLYIGILYLLDWLGKHSPSGCKWRRSADAMYSVQSNSLSEARVQIP
jgi:hypothetical protein